MWTIKADGTDERNISNSPEDEWWPTWSPDGAKIAFVRVTPSAGVGQGNFVVVNIDGSEPHVLKGPFVDGNMPIWSPDGTKLFGFEWVSGSINHHTMPIPPIGGHDGIIVYDLLGRTPPTIVRGADDGTWQRLAD